jgi:phage terminase large subunit-like protein
MKNSSLDRLIGWLGPEAGPALHAYLIAAVRPKTEARIYPDLDDKITQLVEPRFFSPPPTTPGAYFDVGPVDRFLRFCRQLRHIKGSKWAGRKFEPDMWQIVFVIAPLFGWRQEDGLRLRRTLYEEVPKKNGKSTLAAALALYLLTADQEPGAEVVAAAGDKEQARAVFDVASNMAKGSPALAKRLRFIKGQITYEEKVSWFKVLSADGDLKAGLNLHGAVIDELLVQKKRTLVDNLEGATGSREQPLIAYLTTAGLDDPGSIYSEKRNYSEKVAKGDLVDDTWQTVIYTIDVDDDWADPTTWAKANPGLGISVQLDYLQRKCAQAQASPASQNTFLRDHLNVRTGQVTRWLDVKKWDKSGAQWLHPIESQLRGSIAYAGLDLASTSDLAALSIIIPEWVADPDNPDELVEVYNWFLRAWTPKDTLHEREERDQAPYQQWVDEGHLIATPGNVIDYDTIEDEVYRVAGALELRRLHFDRWGSKQIIQHIRDELGHDKVFEMGQGFASMSPAMKEAERLILQERIRHGGNPLLRYSIQSLAVKSDPAGNLKPDRDKSTGRIDPFVAGVMAIDAWSRDPQGLSAYETA